MLSEAKHLGLEVGATVAEILSRAIRLFVISSFLLHLSSLQALAQPSQDEVLRSIGQHIDQRRGDGSKLVALVIAAGGLALLLVVLAQRRKRQVTRKAFNHHGKFVKQVARQIRLGSAELRRLRAAAEQRELISPLTLLLCPSLLDRSSPPTRD